MMQEVEVLKTIQELICSFFPKNSLHYHARHFNLTLSGDYLKLLVDKDMLQDLKR